MTRKSVVCSAKPFSLIGIGGRFCECFTSDILPYKLISVGIPYSPDTSRSWFIKYKIVSVCPHGLIDGTKREKSLPDLTGGIIFPSVIQDHIDRIGITGLYPELPLRLPLFQQTGHDSLGAFQTKPVLGREEDLFRGLVHLQPPQTALIAEHCHKRNTGKDRDDRDDHQKFCQCKSPFPPFSIITRIFHLTFLQIDCPYF